MEQNFTMIGLDILCRFLSYIRCCGSRCISDKTIDSGWSIFTPSEIKTRLIPLFLKDCLTSPEYRVLDSLTAYCIVLCFAIQFLSFIDLAHLFQFLILI